MSQPWQMIKELAKNKNGRKKNERVGTYRVVNTACFPSESKSSIRVVLFLSLWRPRMHLREREKHTIERISRVSVCSEETGSTKVHKEVLRKTHAEIACNYLWERIFVWAGKVVLVQVFEVEQVRARLLGSGERLDLGLFLVLPLCPDHLSLLRLI